LRYVLLLLLFINSTLSAVALQLLLCKLVTLPSCNMRYGSITLPLLVEIGQRERGDPNRAKTPPEFNYELFEKYSVSAGSSSDSYCLFVK
jgi:hypothetical protein